MATPLHHNGEHTAAATRAYHGRRTHVPRPTYRLMAATRRRIKSVIEKKNKQTHATDTTPTRYGTSAIVGRLLRSRYSDTLILTPHHPLRGMIRGYGAVKSPTSISGQKDGTKRTVPHNPRTWKTWGEQNQYGVIRPYPRAPLIYKTWGKRTSTEIPECFSSYA